LPVPLWKDTRSSESKLLKFTAKLKSLASFSSVWHLCDVVVTNFAKRSWLTSLQDQIDALINFVRISKVKFQQYRPNYALNPSKIGFSVWTSSGKFDKGDVIDFMRYKMIYIIYRNTFLLKLLALISRRYLGLTI